MDVVNIDGERFNCVPCDMGPVLFGFCGNVGDSDAENLSSYTCQSTGMEHVNDPSSIGCMHNRCKVEYKPQLPETF